MTIDTISHENSSPGAATSSQEKSLEDQVFLFAQYLVIFFAFRQMTVYIFKGVPRKYTDVQKRHDLLVKQLFRLGSNNRSIQLSRGALDLKYCRQDQRFIYD